uniref:Uncharacterized protein n=1 Tax=Arundo donax TaxID=35708 RepID=A0A0A9BRX8_ARUDO
MLPMPCASLQCPQWANHPQQKHQENSHQRLRKRVLL